MQHLMLFNDQMLDIFSRVPWGAPRWNWWVLALLSMIQKKRQHKKFS